ncbi:MAG: NERD domain-containing protein [Acidimicrobiia bacterium]|nr:NERD domain-containing protein [Acidimicrobiia bacterium]
MDLDVAAQARDKWRQRHPEQCAKGDEGEWLTTQLLADLPASWVVLHRVLPHDKSFDIDHVLIGPGGVIVLDSKNYSVRVQLNKDTLWSGKYALRRELGGAKKYAAYVADVIGIDARPALCIHSAQLPAREFTFDGVDVLSPDRLLRWLHDLPPRLLDVPIVAAVAAARTRFHVLGPVEPVSAPAPASPPQTPAPPPALPPPPGSNGRPPRPPHRPREPRQPRAGSRRFEKLISEALLSFGVLALAAWWLPSHLRSMPHAVTTTTVASARAPLPPPAALKSGSFSCPGRGRGWTLTVPPASTQAGTGAYEVSWSQSPEGPWSAPQRWQPTASLSVAGLTSGGHVFIRAHAANSADAPESMSMQVTPSAAC